MENLNAAILRVMLMDYYGRREASLWLSTWGVPEPEAAAIEGRWKEMLARLLP